MTSLQLAFRKLRVGIVLLQWLGNLLLLLMALAWLQIPDSHGWQLLCSMFSACILVLAFLGLHARTFRKLRTMSTSAPLWSRLLVLLAVTVVGYLMLQFIGVGRSHEPSFAGYWNSKLSASQRSFFTFQRLVEWQDHFYDILQWLFVALFLPAAFIGASTGLRNIASHLRRIYSHLLYWLVVIIFGFAAAWVTSLLAGWTPGHGTAIEILSVSLRLGAAYTLDIILWCFVLALMAVCLGGAQTKEPQP